MSMLRLKKGRQLIFVLSGLFFLLSRPCYGDVIYCFLDRYSLHEQDGLRLNWQQVKTGESSAALFLGKEGHRKKNQIAMAWRLSRPLKRKSVSFARLRMISLGGEIVSHLALSFLPLFPNGLELSQNALKSSNPVLWTIARTWKKGNLKHPLYYFSPDLSPIINQIVENDLQRGPEGNQIALTLEVSNSTSPNNNCILFSPLVVLEIYEDLYDTFLGKEMLGRPTGADIHLSVVPLLKLDFYVEYGQSPGEYEWAAGSTKTSLPSYDPLRNSAPLEPIMVRLSGLLPSRRYYYRIRYREADKGEFQSGPERSFKTRRKRGEQFTFIITADSHIGGLSGKAEGTSPPKDELFLKALENISKEDADFYIILGDEGMTDHAKSQGDALHRYSVWRWFYDKACHSIPLFYVLGNHDGELSWAPENVRLWSREARRTYTVNPDKQTYPQGGHEYGNYYAFTWGDALFVVLDPFLDTGRFNPEYTWYVLRYLGGSWTLGKRQFTWLQRVLEGSEENYKFIFMHHVLASWERNGYGRGGAKYAYHNNQEKLQQLMRKYGVQILFYGHDHVFADGIAGGVHYTCCGQPSSHKGAPPWTRTDDPAYPDFKDAYPYPYLVEKGYVKAEVRNDCTTVRYIKSSLDGTNGKELFSYTINPIPLSKGAY